MSQYAGIATFTYGSVVVTGTDTEFLTEVTVGDSIQVTDEGVPYTVAAIISDTVLYLTGPYSGTTTSEAFVVSRDITPNRGYIEVYPGDKNWRQNLTATIRKIDADMGDFPGPFPFVTKSAKNNALSHAECQGYVVYVDLNNAVVRLPNVTEFRHGAGVTIYAVGSVVVYIRPETADRIRLAGIALDPGDRIKSDGTAGRHIFMHKDSGDGWTTLFPTTGWSDAGFASTTSSTTTSTTTTTSSTTNA
jgi:hypothetical protein